MGVGSSGGSEDKASKKSLEHPPAHLHPPIPAKARAFTAGAL